MADPKGFITLRRATPERQAVAERVRHWGEFYQPVPDASVRTQASRCMDCGVPFCQGDTGCPVRNIIPEWNGLVQRGEWRAAFDSLHSTNNFPELTGRLCPAPCESACVLSIVNEPVAIRHIEQTIADVNVHAHTFRFITPAETDAYKTPNPCNICHKDKSTAWATSVLKRWKDRSPWRVE